MEPLYLENVRASFPHLKAPHAMRPGMEAKYQITLIMPPDHPGWKKVMERAQQLAIAKYGDHAQQMLNLINSDKQKRCYGSGNEKLNKQTMKPLDGFADMVYLSVKSKNRPQLFKPNGEFVDNSNDMQYSAEAGRIYGGCYVNAAIDLYTSKANDGIFAGLIGVQFAKDGESFGGGAPDVSNMFGATQAGAAVPPPSGQAFGQPTAPANTGMPAAPFGAPEMPSFMGGDD